MKKATTTLTIMLALLFGLTGQLLASDDQQSSPPTQAGKKVDISGGADLKWVYQDSILVESRAFTVGGAGVLVGVDSNDYLYADLTLQAKASLDDRTDLTLRAHNRESNRLAGVNNLGVWFDEASVSLKDFMTAGLSLKFGVIPLKINSFFMDANYSESAWNNVNLNSPVLASGGTNRFMEPAGFAFNYSNSQVSVDVMWAVLLDGGDHSRDESILGLVIGVNLPESVGKGSKLNLLYTVFEGGTAAQLSTAHEQSVRTIGIGVNIEGLPMLAGLSFYLDGYFQSGDAGRVSATRTLEAGGEAFRFGLKWMPAGQAMNPWVKLAYWHVSGDSGSTTSTGGVDNDEERFISYENINEFLLVEDNYFGLDIDTNYNSIRFGAGLGSDQFDISLLYGMFTADEDLPGFGTTPPTTSATSTTLMTRQDDIGSEIDVNLTWKYSKVVQFNLTIAQLSGSDVLKLYTTKRDDRVRSIILGTSLSF